MTKLDNQEFHTELGEKIRFIRKVRHINQNDLAHLLRVSSQQVQKYESGKNRIPFEQIVLFCKMMNIQVDELIKKPMKELAMIVGG